jgi:mRNA-degrading endonuclease RelE of RelBE toxin-antitoxin system
MASYQVHIRERARKEIRQLPGNFRQRVLHKLRALEQVPRPVDSTALDIADTTMNLPADTELRRIRLDGWRIVYLVDDDIYLITVLTVRRRPPYQYDDLRLLLDEE